MAEEDNKDTGNVRAGLFILELVERFKEERAKAIEEKEREEEED